jgi:hypothetical protein
MSKLLSKTKYLTGLQCPKLLWIEINEPARIPITDVVTQYTFDQGHWVGDLAKMLFPSGIDIPTDDFTDNITQSKALLEERKPLFEAGILSGRIYCRIDILNPVNGEQWDIIEVKSSTSVKDVHVDDVSFQKYCCEKLGLSIRKCYLMHINNQFVKDGEIDPKELFVLQDISEQVEESSTGIQDRINALLEIISAPQCPEVAIGKHCRNPYICSLSECWESVPMGSVFDLYSGGNKSLELFDNGIQVISDIPDEYKLSGIQQIQKECAITGNPHINRAGIADFLSTLQYPLHYLDFETISPAIPLFDGTRPYQTVPFQFSLHVVRDEFSQAEHYSFLASGTEDPRPMFLKELKKVVGDTGSIIVYNQGFEEGILKELAQAFHQYNDWVNRVCSRLVDLLFPFQKFHYYHTLQKGSASLKAVLPAITGKGYEDLAISNGQVASVSFLSATFGGMSEAERVKVMSDLEKYCGRDTEAMIWIIEKLNELCS